MRCVVRTRATSRRATQGNVGTTACSITIDAAVTQGGLITGSFTALIGKSDDSSDTAQVDGTFNLVDAD